MEREDLMRVSSKTMVNSFLSANNRVKVNRVRSMLNSTGKLDIGEGYQPESDKRISFCL
jgi:hypothetical protein